MFIILFHQLIFILLEDILIIVKSTLNIINIFNNF